MTTKRFIYNGLQIRDLHCKIPPILTNNDKIRDKYLNELNILHEENEQLKLFKKRVFNLLQDEIREESELLDYYLKEKAPCSNVNRQQIIIGVLKRLEKELEE